MKKIYIITSLIVFGFVFKACAYTPPTPWITIEHELASTTLTISQRKSLITQCSQYEKCIRAYDWSLVKSSATTTVVNSWTSTINGETSTTTIFQTVKPSIVCNTYSGSYYCNYSYAISYQKLIPETTETICKQNGETSVVGSVTTYLYSCNPTVIPAHLVDD